MIKTDEINLGKRFKPDTKTESEIKLNKKEELFQSKLLFVKSLANDIDKIGNITNHIDQDFNEKNHLLEDSNI